MAHIFFGVSSLYLLGILIWRPVLVVFGGDAGPFRFLLILSGAWESVSIRTGMEGCTGAFTFGGETSRTGHTLPVRRVFPGAVLSGSGIVACSGNYPGVLRVSVRYPFLRGSRLRLLRSL